MIARLKPFDEEYLVFLDEVKRRVRQARLQSYRTANVELINAYWDIGRGIVERQQRLGWGKGIVKRLAGDLQNAFPGKAGFSAQNLWCMRRFYLAYRGQPKLQQLAREIPWFSNMVILNKVEGDSAREYYLSAVAISGWTRSVLTHQIEAGAYERARLQSKQNNFPQALPGRLAEQAEEAFRDSYALGFMGDIVPVLERDLHAGLMGHIRDFLVELGLGFCFIGSQYRLNLKGKEYFIDLLFFHRKLKCLVAIELKIGDFKPEHAGKMNFYLNILDEQVKLPGENPSIGIILCKSRDRLEVEYSLRGVDKPMGVAQYLLSKNPPRRLAGALPSPSQLQRSLRGPGNGPGLRAS